MRFGKREKIDVLARRHGYFPASFRWRGRRFDIAAVEQVWTERRGDRQRMFQVRSAAGGFVLAHNLTDDTWQIVRSPMALWLIRPAHKPRPQYPLPRKKRRTAPQPGFLARLAERTAQRPAFPSRWLERPDQLRSILSAANGREGSGRTSSLAGRVRRLAGPRRNRPWTPALQRS